MGRILISSIRNAFLILSRRNTFRLRGRERRLVDEKGEPVNVISIAKEDIPENLKKMAISPHRELRS